VKRWKDQNERAVSKRERERERERESEEGGKGEGGEKGRKERARRQAKREARDAGSRVDPAYGQHRSARAPCQGTVDGP